MNAVHEASSITELLASAGAHIRSHGRADCPRCKRRRAVSFDVSKALYYCHGAGCDFSGGAEKLARELGLARRLSPGEREQFHRQYKRADHAARALYARVQTPRFELLEELRSLGRLETTVHSAGTDHPSTWDALALVHRGRPALLAELAILENCRAADLIRFVSASREQRAKVIDGVLMRGGLCDSRGRFVEVFW